MTLHDVPSYLHVAPKWAFIVTNFTFPYSVQDNFCIQLFLGEVHSACYSCIMWADIGFFSSNQIKQNNKPLGWVWSRGIYLWAQLLRMCDHTPPFDKIIMQMDQTLHLRHVLNKIWEASQQCLRGGRCGGWPVKHLCLYRTQEDVVVVRHDPGSGEDLLSAVNRKYRHSLTYHDFVRSTGVGVAAQQPPPPDVSFARLLQGTTMQVPRPLSLCHFGCLHCGQTTHCVGCLKWCLMWTCGRHAQDEQHTSQWTV